jgi:hypothetical protein
VTENWLLLNTNFRKEPYTAIINPKLDFKINSFEYAGAAGGFIDKYGYPYCRGRIFNTLEKKKGQYDDDCDIFWIRCLFFLRSTVY